MPFQALSTKESEVAEFDITRLLFLDSGKDPDLSNVVKVGLLIQSVINGFTFKGLLMELLYLGTTNTHTLTDLWGIDNIKINVLI